MTVCDLPGAPQTTVDPTAPRATISVQEYPVVPSAGSRWPPCQRSVTVPSPCLMAVSHPLGPPSPQHLAVLKRFLQVPQFWMPACFSVKGKSGPRS